MPNTASVFRPGCFIPISFFFATVGIPLTLSDNNLNQLDYGATFKR